MACAYFIDPEHELVLYRPTGRFTESDFMSVSRAVWSDPARKPHFAHVWKAQGIDELVMKASILPMYRDFLATHEEQKTVGKIAVITKRSITRTFASMLIHVGNFDRSTFQTFDDVEAAAQWINLPVEVLTDIPDREWTEP